MQAAIAELAAAEADRANLQASIDEVRGFTHAHKNPLCVATLVPFLSFECSHYRGFSVACCVSTIKSQYSLPCLANIFLRALHKNTTKQKT